MASAGSLAITLSSTKAFAAALSEGINPTRRSWLIDLGLPLIERWVSHRGVLSILAPLIHYSCAVWHSASNHSFTGKPMVTLGNIQAKIAKLQAQAEALVRKESSGALEKIHGLMQKHGITTADIESFIGGKKRGRKSAGTAAPKQRAAAVKYRDPKTGATWTGHGRAPAWIAAAKDRTKFLVEATPAKSSRPASTAAKAGNYVRGAQPPKYRDPKSGATWSGRGRAPAWLAGAKDPSKFLIEAADDTGSAEKLKARRKSVTNRKVAVKSAATGKKTAVKKSTTKTAVQRSKKAPAKKSVVKKAASKKAPAKQVTRGAASSTVTDATAVANLTVPTEGTQTA